MKLVRWFCLLLLGLAPIGVQAATLYVSTQGNDSAAGTSSQPLRTITRAYSLASAGTTILVAPGVYTDYQSGWGLHLGKSGTSSNPIILRSQVRGGAVIDGQDASDRYQAIYIDGSYNVVDGFEIRGGPDGGISIWGNGNQILNNDIHHNGTHASSSGLGQDGVYENENLSGNVFISNYIHDNGRPGSNLDHGLYLCGQNGKVINNVSIRNPASGLQIAGYTTVSNMKVYNNVFAWNGKHGMIVWQNMNGVEIKNNIIYHNGLYGINFYAATGSGVVVDHNLIYGNGSGNYVLDGGSSVNYTMGTTISSDPRFADNASSSFDAHLSSSSPAIGAGLNLTSTFTTDMTGASRPSSGAWDLGAYVYGSGSSDTTSPTVSISSPANGTTVSETITVSASASDNVGVTSVQFTCDGNNLGSTLTAAPYTTSLNTTTLANGSHTLSAVARDAAGNQTTASSVSVSVQNAAPDTTAPTVNPTNPNNGATVSGTITLTASATDNAGGSGVANVSFWVDGTLLGTDNSAPYSMNWDTRTAANGSHAIQARAVDQAGNEGSSGTINVNVDNPPLGTTFEAEQGTLSSPFEAINGSIGQTALTALSTGGRAVYHFVVPQSGDYLLETVVNAPSLAENSFYVSIDGEPSDPAMVWDVLPPTSGFETRTVSWRGSGTGDADEFNPKWFSLSAGEHTLIIVGREANAYIDRISVVRRPEPPFDLMVLW